MSLFITSSDSSPPCTYSLEKQGGDNYSKQDSLVKKLMDCLSITLQVYKFDLSNSGEIVALIEYVGRKYMSIMNVRQDDCTITSCVYWWREFPSMSY